MVPTENRQRSPTNARGRAWVRTAAARSAVTAGLVAASVVVGSYDRTGGHAVLGLALVGGVVYGLALRQQAVPVTAGTLLFFSEAVAVTVLVHLTGGISSEFVLLYPIAVLGAGVALPPKASVAVTTVCAALYVVVVTLEATGMLPYRGGGLHLTSWPGKSAD